METKPEPITMQTATNAAEMAIARTTRAAEMTISTGIRHPVSSTPENDATKTLRVIIDAFHSRFSKLVSWSPGFSRDRPKPVLQKTAAHTIAWP